MNFKKWLVEALEPLGKGIMYQARRGSFIGKNYDLNMISKYEPANLGLFFTNSFENAKKFHNVKEIDTVEIDKKDFAKKNAKGKNLREFIDWVKKQKKIGFPGVVIKNVVDGFFHEELNIVFNTKTIERISTTKIN